MTDKLKQLEAMDSINAEQTVDELGYRKITIDKLPSRGLFYPEDVYIGVKPANVAEIRHWSMIDETDDYSFIEAMDFVLANCVIIKSGKKRLNISDLCEVDRLYLIFAIRQDTFNDDENVVYVDVPYTYKNQEYTDSVAITTENLNYFEVPEKLMKLYDATKRAFVVKGTQEFEVRLASIGMANRIQEYIETRLKSGKSVDEFYAKVAPFIHKNYNTLTDEVYFNGEVDSNKWSINDISVLDRITKFISDGAKQGFKHKTKHGGVEVVVPLNFRDGLKSIFIISDILGEF